MLRTFLKILIVFFGLYEFTNILIRAICIMATLSIYGLLIIKSRPYLQRSCNYLDLLNCLICQLFILIFCILSYSQTKDQSQQLQQTLEHRFQKLILQVFAGFLIGLLLVLMFRFYKTMVRFLFRNLYWKLEVSI